MGRNSRRALGVLARETEWILTPFFEIGNIGEDIQRRICCVQYGHVEYRISLGINSVEMTNNHVISGFNKKLNLFCSLPF